MTDRFINILLEKINAQYNPEIVPVMIEEYSIPLSCYSNVEKKVLEDGGSIHYGWNIHENGSIYEAEHHAVWENEQGDLIDITPNQLNKAEILFVSDNKFVDNGQSLDNVRINITRNVIVDDFILIAEFIFKLYNFGKRIDDLQFLISPNINRMILEYEMLKGQLDLLIKSGVTEMSKCYCGSRKSYKNCHHQLLKNSISTDYKKAKEYAKSKN